MRIRINISQKVAVMALFVVLIFAVTGLTAVTLLSESFVVAQERERERSDPISGCFKTIGETEVAHAGGDTQNWTESIQNFVSLIPADNSITLVNENVVGDSGPITDIVGIWNVLINENNTAHDRQTVLTEVNSLLAAAQPGFTQTQQEALSRCITNATNSLGPTPNY
jgi:hypothetical protein